MIPTRSISPRKISILVAAYLVRSSKSFSVIPTSISICATAIGTQRDLRRNIISRKMSSSSPLTLKDPSLLPDVGSSSSSDDDTFDVYDPADPSTIVGTVRNMNRDDTKRIVQRSNEALASWRDDTTASYRCSLLQNWSQLIKENSDDIARIMTYESGKPLKESVGEIAYGVSFLDFYAAEGIRHTGAGGGFLVPTPFATPDGKPRGQIMAIQQAIGVTALITPWNFPIAMITRKVGPALAVGCTAILKPSELTPLTAVALKTLANRAGIPNDVFQLVTTNREATPQVGEELCLNPSIQKISFTGSTNVGKLLMKLSSSNVKKLSLELGGNAPFIVFEDADIDLAVNSAMAAKFRNAGQTCVCADRFLIHEAVYEEFVQKFTEKVQSLQVGPGVSNSTTMGPLIATNAVENTHGKVQEAIQNDKAQCVTGGSPMPELGPQFYKPTILTNVLPTSKIWSTETFGPVAAIKTFQTEEEALALANDCDVGLAGYICTKDLSRTFRVSKKLECGIVGINDGIISSCTAPFGGVKESGLGREGSHLGIEEYLETKYMFINA